MFILHANRVQLQFQHMTKILGLSPKIVLFPVPTHTLQLVNFIPCTEVTKLELFSYVTKICYTCNLFFTPCVYVVCDQTRVSTIENCTCIQTGQLTYTYPSFLCN